MLRVDSNVFVDIYAEYVQSAPSRNKIRARDNASRSALHRKELRARDRALIDAHRYIYRGEVNNHRPK